MTSCFSFDIENHPDVVKIGTETEKGISEIKVDFTYWLTQWPDLKITLLVKNPKGVIYIPNFSVEDSILTWSIEESDTSIPGVGEMEFVGESEDKRVISDVVRYSLRKRMSGTASSTAPESSSSWVNNVLAAADIASVSAKSASESLEAISEKEALVNDTAEVVREYATNAALAASKAQDVADEIKSIKASAQTLEPGSEATASYDSDTGVITIGVPRGDKGETGATPKLTVGTVETLPSNQNGSASIDGTAENPVLNLKIPKGEKGDAGSTPSFTIGTVTTLEPDESATASITGTSEEPVLNLGVPRGIQGTPGTTGDAPAILLTEGPSGVVETDLAAKGYSLEPVSTISFTQEGEGDPSPDNIRPIVGWDTINLTRCGKNLLDLSKAFVWPKAYGLTTSIDGDTITVSGVYSRNIDDATATKPSFRILSVLTEASKFKVFALSGSDKIDRVYKNTTDNTITIQLIDMVVGSEVEISFQLMGYAGEDPDTYEPYQGDDYTSTLPETIYGGTYNWKTGELVVDKAMITLSGDEQEIRTWGVNVHADGLTGFIFYINLNDYLDFDVEKRSKARCSHFPNSYTWGSYYTGLYLSVDAPHYFALIVPNNLLSDVSSSNSAISSFREWLSSQVSLENPVQISYLIEEPQTYHLSPQEIIALDGTNTLFSDCGDTKVTFTADTKKYIDMKIEELMST